MRTGRARTMDASNDDGDYEEDFDEVVEASVRPAPLPVGSVEAEESGPVSAAALSSAPRSSPSSPSSSTGESKARSRRPSTTRRRRHVAGRSVLDQSPWTYTVRARRIRSLRIPLPLPSSGSSLRGGPRIIRDLRVFGVLDKQPTQSKGSRWRQEPPVEMPAPALALRRAALNTHAGPGRRTGLLEEATWRHDDGDLQWIFSLDRFRRLKAYSPRIKLFVFGIGTNAQDESVQTLSESSPKEHNESIISLGWFFLDLRTPDLPQRWIKLQNAQFGGEIMVSSTFTPLNIEMGNDHIQSTPAVVGQRSNPSVWPRIESSGASGGVRTTHGDVECLRLGQRSGTMVYLVSVIVKSCSSLQSLVRSKLSPRGARRARATGFWLSYSLFDVVVQTDVFHDLDKPEFFPIRDSFRLLSCAEDMHDFFESHRSVTIYLCTESQVLAGAEVPLGHFLGSKPFNQDGNIPATAENNTRDDVFYFESSQGRACAGVAVTIEITSEEAINHDDSGAKRDAVAMPNDDGATQRVSIFLEAYSIKLIPSVIVAYTGREGVLIEAMIGDQAMRQMVSLNVATNDHVLGHSGVFNFVDSPDMDHRISLSLCTSVSDTLLGSSTEMDVHLLSKGSVSMTLQREGNYVGEVLLRAVDAAKHQSVNSSVIGTVPTVSRTYRVLFHLRSIRDFDTACPILIMFINPFTGKEKLESPVITTVQRAEVSVPDAIWLFELHRDEASLKKMMESALVMDVCECMADGIPVTVGNAIFSLNFLFYSEQQFSCCEPTCGTVYKSKVDAIAHWNKEHGVSDVKPSREAIARVHSFKTCSIVLPVMCTTRGLSASKRVGAIEIIAYLEDFGPMPDEEIEMAESGMVPRIATAKQRRVHFELEPAASTPPDNIRDGSMNTLHWRSERQPNDSPCVATGERAGVQEVHNNLVQREEWKRRMELAEKCRMDELEEEWARREEERNSLFKAAQAEYQLLQQKLRASLMEVEARERKLEAAEASFERDQRMHREDNDILRNRMRSELSHELAMANKQVEALEKQVKMLRSQLQSSEKRTTELEEDFAEYRKQQRKVPESKLREEISSLKGQIVELEKARLVDIRAKNSAEETVEKMRRQLEKMAKAIQAEKKRSESQVVDELEKLRLKYVAREERFVLDGDREELRAIKKQLDDLRHAHITGSIPSTQNGKGISAHLATKSRAEDDSLRRHSWSSPHIPQSHENAEGNFQAVKSPLSRAKGNENSSRSMNTFDKELSRLVHERDILLANGDYDEKSYLVRELDRLIALRKDELRRRYI